MIAALLGFPNMLEIPNVFCQMKVASVTLVSCPNPGLILAKKQGARMDTTAFARTVALKLLRKDDT